MINLTLEQLIAVANTFRNDNWFPPLDKGSGEEHILVGDIYVMYFSYVGTINIYNKETSDKVDLNYALENYMRKILYENLNKNK
jgi:hypothetical protein